MNFPEEHFNFNFDRMSFRSSKKNVRLSKPPKLSVILTRRQTPFFILIYSVSCKKSFR